MQPDPDGARARWPVSRRQLLRLAGLAIVGTSAGGLLAACSAPPAPAKPAEPAGAAKPTEAAKPAAAAPAAPAAAPKPTEAPKPAAAAPAAAPTAAAPAAKAGAPKRGGTLVVAQDADVQTLDPGFTTSQSDRQIFASLYDKLVRIDPDGKLAPELAESWEQAADGRSWTFKLRTGVKFHDGTDFNAEAVKANIDRFVDDAVKSPRKGELGYVTGATAVDAATVRIQVSQPLVVLPYLLADTSGVMASPTAVQKFGADFARNPVGTGPFAFKEWIKGDRLTLVRNDTYWREGRPYLESVTYKGIPDQSVILNGMRSKAIQATRDIAAKDIPPLKSDPSFNLIAVPSCSLTSLRFNLAAAPFDKKELRQALTWAVDREAIEKALFFSTGTPANQVMTPQMLGYTKEITAYTTVDLDKAKSLLAAGGQPNGFTFTATGTNIPEIVQLGQALKSQFEKIGVTMELQLVDNTTLQQKQTNKEFQSIINTYNSGVEPFQIFSRQFLSTSALNAFSYKSAEYDALLGKAAETSDTDARAKIYAQMSVLLAEDVPWCYIRCPPRTQLFAKEIQGYVFNADYFLHLDTVSM